MNQSTDSKTIVLTGASRGIGASIALTLAKGGANVACLSRSGAVPDADGHDIDEIRSRVLPIACDVTDTAGFAAALEQAKAKFGRIDGLVNNAGVHEIKRSVDVTNDDFERVFAINTTAVFSACRDTLPYLREHENSVIVNIGSFFERLGAKQNTAYSASKAAVGAITRCLAAEWGRYGVSVVNIAPGYILTDINKDYLASEVGMAEIAARSFLKRPGRVDEIATLVETIVTGKIPFLTGETIFVDGGYGISR